MDLMPLTVSQLDGTSPITDEEWDVLDRNWDSINEGGAGPLTAADFKTILLRDPFATNLSGAGPATAPATTPVEANQYPIFDPNIQSVDPVTGACGSRYDFVPGFSTTFPFTPLGNDNGPITQTYTLGTTNTTSSGSTTTDTYTVSLSGSYTPSIKGLVPSQIASLLETQQNTKNVISGSFTASGQFTWTNKWTTSQNNSTLEQETLSIKNPGPSDNYTGPEEIQVWKDNLYGTFMFYPSPSDTAWVMSASQNSISAGQSVTLTASVTADPSVPYTPTGTVSFYDGCTVLGTAQLNVATGTATLSIPLSSPGTHNIQGVYSGDPNFFHNSVSPVSIAVQ